MPSATTNECIIGLKQQLAAAGFIVLDTSPFVDDPTVAAATLLTNSSDVGQALRGGSGLGEEAKQLGACAATRTALNIQKNVPGALAGYVARQRAMFPPPPPPPAPPAGPLMSTETITYIGLGVLGLGTVVGLYMALRRKPGRRR